MFTHSAKYYDTFYSFKDYIGETQKLIKLIHKHKSIENLTLLDIGCGTGSHLYHLQDKFKVTGLDSDNNFLEMAQQKMPEVSFYQADMIDFQIEEKFDVITCLFSSIGYVKSTENLNKAIGCMAKHLNLGGIIALEPWFTPEQWKPGTIHLQVVEEENRKLVRLSTSQITGLISYFDFHYLIATETGTDHYVERHELGLFTKEQMIEAFLNHNLQVLYDNEGLDGRGLYIGIQDAGI